MYLCIFLDYDCIIARIYSKKTVVNFICLNKQFVIVIVTTRFTSRTFKLMKFTVHI